MSSNFFDSDIELLAQDYKKILDKNESKKTIVEVISVLLSFTFSIFFTYIFLIDIWWSPISNKFYSFPNDLYNLISTLTTISLLSIFGVLFFLFFQIFKIILDPLGGYSEDILCEAFPEESTAYDLYLTEKYKDLHFLKSKDYILKQKRITDKFVKEARSKFGKNL